MIFPKQRDTVHHASMDHLLPNALRANTVYLFFGQNYLEILKCYVLVGTGSSEPSDFPVQLFLFISCKLDWLRWKRMLGASLWLPSEKTDMKYLSHTGLLSELQPKPESNVSNSESRKIRIADFLHPLSILHLRWHNSLNFHLAHAD